MMKKFGLFFGTMETTVLIDMETGNILIYSSDRDAVQRWLSAYEGSYTLTLLNQCNGKIGVDKFQPLWYNNTITRR